MRLLTEFLYVAEPSPGDLTSLLQWGCNPSKSQRRLLIFTSEIHDLSKSALQTPCVDIHILSKNLRESSRGQAVHLIGVLEKASQFAIAWRADAGRLSRENQLTKDSDTLSFSRSDSAHLSAGIDNPKLNPTRNTPVILNNAYDDSSKLYVQSSSKSTVNRSTVQASKGLLPDFLNFSLTSVSRPPTQPIRHPKNATSSSFHSQHQCFFLETHDRTFDTIMNFLPLNLTERSLLKQVILVSTLCGQYFARSGPESPINPGRRSPNSPSSFSRTPPTECEADNAQRISAAPLRPSSVSASVSSATSSTPTERWSIWSHFSTTSTSQASDPDPEATKFDNSSHDVDATEMSIERILSYLFSRATKRPNLNRSPQCEDIISEYEEAGCTRKNMKIVSFWPFSTFSR